MGELLEIAYNPGMPIGPGKSGMIEQAVNKMSKVLMNAVFSGRHHVAFIVGSWWVQRSL